MSSALNRKPFVIEDKAIKKASSIYRAINHSVRLQIIGIIHKAASINVTPIIEKLKLEQPVVSAHLKILRDAEIVSTERRARCVYYSINYKQVERISMLAEKLIPYSVNTNFLPNTERKLTIKSKEDTVTFTPMELKVIRLVCQANTNEEIAQKLGLSRRTIEEHKSNIIKKMKVRNSVGILIFAVKKGLVKV